MPGFSVGSTWGRANGAVFKVIVGDPGDAAAEAAAAGATGAALCVGAAAGGSKDASPLPRTDLV